ncbi:hypothetical protein M422DRAFT_22904 [Sphaerobolus stellatus SS14]|nr:hypothetical protein M422DRAFT_22904 [Sphaerobolus stellatus SS14]
MPSYSCESLTVTVLPDLLALVHIPRSRLVQFSHQVVKQILSPSPSFLNITCNNIELSLFAHHSVLADFEPLARRDRHRLKKAHSSRRTQNRSRQNSVNTPEPVEVSYDTWNVLQLDSHDDRLDKAGARVRELSAPLAQAGISILYQSSYTSDFIFVKSSRLNEVLARLAQAGFEGYSSDVLSGIPSIIPLVQDESELDDTSISRTGSATQLVLQRDNTPVSQASSSPSDSETVTPTATPSSASRTSASPCAGDVQILDQDVVCVGLSDSAADVWTSKIIKLVAYPELLLPALSSTSRAAQADAIESDPAVESLDDETAPSSKFGIDIPRRRPDFWSYPSPSASSTSSSVGTPPSSSEDGYFSSEIPYTPPSSGEGSPRASPIACSRSFPELTELIKGSSNIHSHLPRVSTVTGNMSSAFRPVSTSLNKKANPVPFFSFTRTDEGSSLTTGREVITALFPLHERHMIICGDELDDDEEEENDEGAWGDEFEDNVGAPSRMKCLQIDLHRFGLDKHGLINRFSRVLDSSGINHMYSSTYKTANLLVNKKDALRASNLLRSC